MSILSVQVNITWQSFIFSKKLVLLFTSNSDIKSSKSKIGVSPISSFTISSSQSFKDNIAVLCWPCDPKTETGLWLTYIIKSSLWIPVAVYPLDISIFLEFINAFLKESMSFPLEIYLTFIISSLSFPHFVIELWITSILAFIASVYLFLYSYIWLENFANCSSHISKSSSLLFYNFI